MKQKTVFVCSVCGGESSKWVGKCPSCDSWNTMVEEVKTEPLKNAAYVRESKAAPVRLCDITTEDYKRYKCGINELDRFLGGGVVRGSLVLVGGDPGIGKSTLLLQLAKSVDKEYKIFYVSGEESEKQLKMRADRIAVDNENFMVLAETDSTVMMQHAKKMRPDIMIVDSIQTMFNSDLPSAPGSVGQVRDVTLTLMRFAKETGTSVFIVGHVTKDGAIAGPKVLEHMVDCVLYFEGEKSRSYRVLRAVKNRFGSTNEIGVFEMSDKGLKEVINPSSMLLEGRPADAPGSAVVCSLEGTRPMLAEVQALVCSSSFGMPRRMATGIDINRVNLIVAVLEKRMGLNLQNQDIYVNIIGGIKLFETAVDLGIAMAIVSSFRNRAVDKELVAIGEIGLTGELRGINRIESRINEVKKLGFQRVIIPYANKKEAGSTEGINVIAAKNTVEALSYII